MTNILGTQNLLDAARRAWVTGKDEYGYPTWRKGVRYHQVSTDEVYGSLGAEGYFHETTPLCPHSPYSASKTSADMVVMAYHDTLSRIFLKVRNFLCMETVAMCATGCTWKIIARLSTW